MIQQVFDNSKTLIKFKLKSIRSMKIEDRPGARDPLRLEDLTSRQDKGHKVDWKILKENINLKLLKKLVCFYPLN